MPHGKRLEKPARIILKIQLSSLLSCGLPAAGSLGNCLRMGLFEPLRALLRRAATGQAVRSA